MLIPFKNKWIDIFLAFMSQSWCRADYDYPINVGDHTQAKPSK
ncbi:hypothetical protein DN399_11875 [Bacillus sp. AR4-2]|nr:hypothetical protein DN399_11875 [Bacillus sp. AR4-2]QEL74010.1 hypothetical protein DN405_11880 [Bacillus sp. SH8-8]